MSLPARCEPQIEAKPYAYPYLVRAAERLSSAEKFAYKLLSGIEHGSLSVTNSYGKTRHFGVASGNIFHQTSPSAHLVIHNRKFFERVLVGASLALGESYVDGWWNEHDDNICDVLGVLLRNHIDSKVSASWGDWLKTYLHTMLWNPRSISLARKCIHAHYDLGNEFFKLFLDPSMAYSCGYEMRPGDSLAQMQEQKYERICKKLGLARGGSLLDIGCGWGGLLIHAATHYPEIKCLGITISQQQYELAQARIKAAGLAERIEIRLCDYRKLQERFDFVVSVGMFEHVGLASYDIFMRQLKKFLRPSGIGLLHTIALTDGPSVAADPWISRYIFPGSRLPRLEELVQGLQTQGMAAVHIENLKLHYAKTLRHWKNNLDKNREEILSLGAPFDEKFLRLWNYYLQTCEAGFRYSTMQLYQVLFCDAESWSAPMCLNF